jgi:signal transduction histidine kinase/ActR/RegA family two-component response regulator
VRIRGVVASMVAAIMLPIVLASAYAVNEIRLAEKRTALASLHKTVDAIGITVDKAIYSSIAALNTLGNSELLQTGKFEEFYAQAKLLNKSKDSWVALIMPDGEQVLNTAVPFEKPPMPSPSLEIINRVLQTQKTIVSDVFVGPRTGRQIIVVYAPTSKVGSTQYVLAQAFALTYWENFSEPLNLPKDWIVAVIDRAGRFIARSHRSDKLLGQLARSELIAAAAEQDRGLIRHSTLEGVESYDAFNHSKLTGWTIAVAAPVALIDSPVMRAVQTAVGGFTLAILLSGILATLFGRGFVSALSKASVTANALGQGVMPKTVSRVKIVELDELIQSLANAGQLLQEERSARAIAEAERERLLIVEHKAYLQIQKENTTKDQFLAMLGHELRNPLAAISGAVALLTHADNAAQGKNRNLEIISRQNRHLIHIIDDLLDMSRLMAGKIVLNLQPLDLAECLHKSIDGLTAAHRTNKHTVIVTAEPVCINADPVRIEQIIVNLVGNALKFSAPGSAINISLRQDSGQAILSVQDQGTGMTLALLAELFNLFTQGPPAAGNDQRGMGVGLALVKQLVELHGGTVTATSAGLNQGSTFLYHFPALLAPASGSAPAAKPAASPQPRQLLYVEDSADVRSVTSEMLSLSGYKVTGVKNGKDALDAARAHVPDAILMDIGLPDMSGYEVAIQMRQIANLSKIPMIAITGYGQASDKVASAKAGFNAHLIKPVDPDELIRTLEAVFVTAFQSNGLDN